MVVSVLFQTFLVIKQLPASLVLLTNSKEDQDEVMADREFNIQEMLASKGLRVDVMNESGQYTEQECSSPGGLLLLGYMLNEQLNMLNK